MSRVSHSILDPYISPLVPKLYRALHIPRRFPPEGIVGIGHLCAIGGAVAFAFGVEYWWAGLIGSLGVAANHIADMVDGTHARSTGQCRNGGELLDHFTDPLSFSYWMIGLSVACDRLDLALAAVLGIYATAVLTSIRAKLVGEFTLARFGPTEFKTLLVAFGVFLAIFHQFENAKPQAAITGFLYTLLAIGIPHLIYKLITSVIDVNRRGKAPDTTNWVTRDQTKATNANAADTPDAPNA